MIETKDASYFVSGEKDKPKKPVSSRDKEGKDHERHVKKKDKKDKAKDKEDKDKDRKAGDKKGERSKVNGCSFNHLDG